MILERLVISADRYAGLEYRWREQAEIRLGHG